MKALFIGGTGIISSACAPEAVRRGIDLTILNRGREGRRPLPDGARVVQGDIRDPGSVRAALGDETFDAVVNWIAFTPDQVETDLNLFAGRTGQYVFISSASAYQKPVAHLPITESTPLVNPFWEYSRNKIACEERLMRAHRETGFPVTIVRPSHTYDRTLLPFDGGYTVLDRLKRGKPVVVQGDGTSLWVLTHHEDFARAFVSLLGNSHALGTAVQITSDELLTWNGIFETVGRAAGAKPELVHVPSDAIARFIPEFGPGLLGDKSHSVMFDNTKIKRL
ncbi:MAG TPA: SDR family oxidoreductase, partial [Deinococcales bacterium]|nr:SDR family oxidoreductase [Deinococcales bacterium]